VALAAGVRNKGQQLRQGLHSAATGISEYLLLLLLLLHCRP
jgi:hypothetical protein